MITPEDFVAVRNDARHALLKKVESMAGTAQTVEQIRELSGAYADIINTENWGEAQQS